MALLVAGCQMPSVSIEQQACSNTPPILARQRTNTVHSFRTISMTALKIHSSRRRRTAPPPSAAVIAMWERGLELTLEDSLTRSPADLKVTESSRQTSQALNSSTSPADSHYSFTSSMYSTESAQSRDSIETTISQIVDMYTDLINKISSAHEQSPTGIEILQPTAYRDTVASLLQRRFSIEQRPPSAPPPSHIPESHGARKRSASSLRHIHQQPMGFQEFTQNLKQRRADLVSPLPAHSSGYEEYATVDVVSEPSPITPMERTPSFTGGETDQVFSIPTRRSVSPILGRAEAAMSGPVSESAMTGTSSRISDQSASLSQLPFVTETQWQTQRGRDVESYPQPSSRVMQELNEFSKLQVESDRFYKHHSAEQLASYRSVVCPDTGKAMRAKIKERIRRMRENKEKAGITPMAAHKYPFVKGESRRSKTSFIDHATSDVATEIDCKAKILSDTRSTGDYLSSQPRQISKQAAIPLTAYQKYGKEAWSLENKELKAETRRNKITHESQLLSSFRHRAASDAASQSRHARMASSQMDQTADSEKSQLKRTKLVAVLQGAKNGLVSSSAERRREKLKESIVVMGSAPLALTDETANIKPQH